MRVRQEESTVKEVNGYDSQTEVRGRGRRRDIEGRIL